MSSLIHLLHRIHEGPQFEGILLYVKIADVSFIRGKNGISLLRFWYVTMRCLLMLMLRAYPFRPSKGSECQESCFAVDKDLPEPC